jgi:hypothetical protein
MKSKSIVCQTQNIFRLYISDYDHLYIKFLRGGGLDVATTLNVIKSLAREYQGRHLTNSWKLERIIAFKL